MRNPYILTVAKCCTEKSCKKCGSISNAIMVKRNVHYTLYCESCGAYIKHASDEDKRHTFISKVSIADNTPMLVSMLYIESNKSLINK